MMTVQGAGATAREGVQGLPPRRAGLRVPPRPAGLVATVLAAVTAALAAQAPPRAFAAKNDGGPVTFNAAEAAEVSRRLAAEPRLLRTFTACPADTYERERPFWRRLAKPRPPSTRTCTAHPAACVGWFNAPACFELALVYDGHLGEVADVLDKERLFALACAGGFPAGCTNRAAGIRNRDFPGDPFRDASLATKQTCEYRSFRIDCDRGGSWGCAMLGQAYRNGEGVAAQAAAARTALEGACKRDPGFVACTFAKDLLKEMNEPDRPATGQPKPERSELKRPRAQAKGRGAEATCGRVAEPAVKPRYEQWRPDARLAKRRPSIAPCRWTTCAGAT